MARGRHPASPCAPDPASYRRRCRRGRWQRGRSAASARAGSGTFFARSASDGLAWPRPSRPERLLIGPGFVLSSSGLGTQNGESRQQAAIVSVSGQCQFHLRGQLCRKTKQNGNIHTNHLGGRGWECGGDGPGAKMLWYHFLSPLLSCTARNRPRNPTPNKPKC